MPESLTSEYKKSFGKEAIISLVAFANTDGGAVIIGVDDNGRTCGVEVGPETVQRYVNEIKVATYPQLIPKVLVEEREGKQILVFEIGEFPVKPVSYKNRYYRRVHNSNHLMTLEEIVDLQQQSLSLSFDAYPSPEPLSVLDTALIEKYFGLVNQCGRFTLREDLETNLIKLKLVRDGKSTFAANLLFGEPHVHIRIGRFKSESTIIDDIVVRSPLFVAVDETLTFIKKYINLSYSFDGSRERKERWQYPLEALRELVLNAVVHRDYKNVSDIVIKIFDDRIVITNPGRLYGTLTLAELAGNQYVSSLRNRLIAEAFYLTGDIERYGTGYIRIREYLTVYPDLTLQVEEQGDFFRAELRLTTAQVTAQVTPQVTAQVTPQVTPQVTAQVTPQVTAQVTAQVTPQVLRMLQILDNPTTRRELQELLHLQHREHFRREYLQPALKAGFIVMTAPDKPRSADQRYVLTEAGKAILDVVL